MRKERNGVKDFAVASLVATFFVAAGWKAVSDIRCLWHGTEEACAVTNKFDLSFR